ncbi:hypothetical protein [uncultured Draconibacterium sp.]|uniref:hypothetical protein n=1 Tax=uncultured Draconibacterium sp. TaxID=1573823 RepID=UPI0029BFCE17|nr:hypothetical protein [uncultured Draconibacterium sp.]
MKIVGNKGKMGVLNSNHTEISQMLPEKAKYFLLFKKHGFKSFLFVHLIGEIMDYLMVGVSRDMLVGINKMGMKHVANEIFKN